MTTPRGIHEVRNSWSPFAKLKGHPQRVISRARKRLLLSRAFISEVRYELEMLALRTRNAVSRSQRTRLRDLSAATNLKINIGCGKDVLDGWLNLDSFAPSFKTDVLLLDLRQPIPLPSGCAELIYSEHFLEHLDRTEHAKPLLRELHRLLVRGGSLRISVPDGGKFVAAYFDHNHPTRAAFSATVPWMTGTEPWMEYINAIMGAGHKYLYDAEVLTADLREAGFSTARETGPHDISNPDPLRRAISLYVEAIK